MLSDVPSHRRLSHYQLYSRTINHEFKSWNWSLHDCIIIMPHPLFSICHMQHTILPNAIHWLSKLHLMNLLLLCAVANLFSTESILIFTFLSPAFVFFTKITKLRIFVIPSPDFPVPMILTAYSLPVSSGFGKLILINLDWPPNQYNRVDGELLYPSTPSWWTRQNFSRRHILYNIQ